MILTFSNGPLHMDLPVLADQQETTYKSSVRTLDVVWKTGSEWWMIGTIGESERVRWVWASGSIW